MKYLIPSLIFTASALTGCKKASFVELNTNPNIVYSISAKEQILNVARRAHNNDFEAYYEKYRRIMPWMQMNTPQTGNSKNFLNDLGNFNSRYGTFFPELGVAATDAQKIIEAMPDDQRATYSQIYEIADLNKIQYAFYVSDINGSIPYTEAFIARYGGPIDPVYQPQQELFGIWDTRLKEIVANLSATPAVTQESLGQYDLYFNGDVAKWVKAANALRLRLALRWMKRDAAKASAIVTEVLASPAQMESNADGWVMTAHASLTAGGNFNPVTLRAPKPSVDFMWENEDPRIRAFYQPNNYTEANFNAAKAAGIYPSSATWNPRRYVGAPTVPDVSTGSAASWFTAKEVNSGLSLDTISYLQYRLLQPAYPDDNGTVGTGTDRLPVITYADYCFMRAEFIVRNMATGSAEEWYNKGVTASLEFYNEAAVAAAIVGYTALQPAEITNYLEQTDVKFDAGKALEQIIVQAYINFYKQPNEAWANYKRTGMPNKNTVLANPDIVIDGVAREIPRRASFNVPNEADVNFNTRSAALDQMAQDPGFGQGPSDMFGRVWWDVVQ